MDMSANLFLTVAVKDNQGVIVPQTTFIMAFLS